MSIRSLLFSIVIAIATFVIPARADVILHATNNGTIQPGGPRTGNNGKQFFNMEGSANGSFASFGVIDFTPAAVNDSFTSLTVSLTQDDAAFTAPGSLSFYVVTDTTTSIDPNSSPLLFEASSLPGGVGNQLGTKYLLGTGSFTGLSNGSTQGRTDTFSFLLTDGAQTYVDQELQAGKPLRLLVTPVDATVAATYAGYTDDLPGPAILLGSGSSSVPEPSMWGLLLGVGVIMANRRMSHSRASSSSTSRI